MYTKLLATVVIIFVVFVLWSANAGTMPALIHTLYHFPHGDRVGHIGIYALLAFVLSLAWPKPVSLFSYSVPIATIALLIFALGEEISQAFLVSRTADVVDLLCSWVGVVVGSVGASFWLAQKK